LIDFARSQRTGGARARVRDRVIELATLS
jgi:hypothetical protein